MAEKAAARSDGQHDATRVALTITPIDGHEPDAVLSQVLEYATGCHGAVEDPVGLPLPPEFRAELAAVQAHLDRAITLTMWRLGAVDPP